MCAAAHGFAARAALQSHFLVALPEWPLANDQETIVHKFSASRFPADMFTRAVIVVALVFALLALTLMINGMWASGKSEDWLYLAAALAWLVTFAGLVSTLLHLRRR
jgi:hypothetical protein